MTPSRTMRFFGFRRLLSRMTVATRVAVAPECLEHGKNFFLHSAVGHGVGIGLRRWADLSPSTGAA
jgi:hypothetical protein